MAVKWWVSQEIRRGLFWTNAGCWGKNIEKARVYRLKIEAEDPSMPRLYRAVPVSVTIRPLKPAKGDKR